MTTSDTLNAALECAFRAGTAIMSIYRTDFGVEQKSDNSPLTQADMAAHTIIKESLEQRFPYPVLSEEDSSIAYQERKDWQTFWLVDPLDGTKEFIKKNGEFTVNIALIENSVPTLGVVFAPALQLLYFASPESGARRIQEVDPHMAAIEPDQLLQSSQLLPVATKRSTLCVVASRSHCNEETQAFIRDLEKTYGKAERVASGSSLKLCLVAEGKADVYPRIAPTMEWDTAAADAVVRAAGGTVVQHSSGTPLVYNKADLSNPSFVVYSQAMTAEQSWIIPQHTDD